MEIPQITVKQLATVGGEGIVLIGCGGDLNEWISGVKQILIKENIIQSLATFYPPSSLITTGGRVDIALRFLPEAKIDIGKLAMWRLRFGNVKWISDYVDIYKNQHEDVVLSETDTSSDSSDSSDSISD